jgi:DNA-binding response OmpR family regulator
MTIRILLAEDDDNSAALLHRILGPITDRFDVEKTLIGAERKAALYEYDVVILDLRLEDSDIENTIRAIPRLKRATKAPIVVITGMPDPDLEQQCLNAGADKFLAKNEAYSLTTNILHQAVYVALMHHPKNRGPNFEDHMKMLQKMVAA